MSKIKTYVVIADLSRESKNAELAKFFDRAHAGRWMADNRIDGMDNVRLEEVEEHVDMLHSAHHPLFLCQACVDNIGRADKHASALPKDKCVKCASKKS